METSFKKIQEFQTAAFAYLNTHKEETKIVEALKDVLDQLEPVGEEQKKGTTRLQRKHALEDKYGAILRDEKGNYRFSKEGEEKLENELEDMNNHIKEFDLVPALLAEVPKSLEKMFIRKFAGFIFEPDAPTEK